MKRKLLLIIMALTSLLCSCTAGSPPPVNSEPTAREETLSMLMLVDESVYEYMKKAIDCCIEDELPINSELELMVIKRDRSADGGYKLPMGGINAWLEESPQGRRALLLYDLAPEDNIIALTDRLSEDALIITVGNSYDIDTYYDLSIDIDYDALAVQQGRLLAEAAAEGGDILFTPRSRNSIDADVLSPAQQLTADTVRSCAAGGEVTFTYGKRYEEYGDVEANAAMADEYLSSHKNVIGIVGETDATCVLWLEAIERNGIVKKPLIFGGLCDADGLGLIRDNDNVVLFSDPFAYYELTRAALSCAARYIDEDDIPVGKSVPVEQMLLTHNNLAEHLREYGEIYG